MNKILKSGGYCSDGCQWNFCDFWICQDEPVSVVIEGACITRKVHRCALFGNAEMDRGSLICCNKIYGLEYEGKP